MYAAPAIFWGLWKAVSPFIDPVTRAKVVFVGDKQAQLLVDALGPQVRGAAATAMLVASGSTS